MIRITVDLVSARGPQYSRRLALLHISNTGEGTATRGEYAVACWAGGAKHPRTAIVRDYPRKALAALNLLTRALRALGYDK